MKRIVSTLAIASLVLIGAYAYAPNWYITPTIERAAPPRVTITPKRRHP